MATVDFDDSFKAKIQYLARDDQHQLVKPYYLYFKYDSDLARTNTTADDRFVSICNARKLDIPSSEMFSEWGFAQLRVDCPLTPEEYWYSGKVEEVLYPQYKSIARSLFPDAARVEILEHSVSKDPKTEGFKRLIKRSQIRKRDPRWLSENIERHEFNTSQPSDYVHIGRCSSSYI